ncbi:ergothioneine biosynthesis protein EgtB [Herminiimonas fonticola]|uniref:Ergothioneine biosynthesis protein EgtB n=1 Tax=Herminiimonas fonticola TaxID=303380 RepID=A0A4R6GI36_9BURK|nr:ergothioneine biosynthesis protein EgtB [Herminiimonas fonticola]RBA25546.1 ergothioneine biosynthesis protein EgtB [Herminiimonas fonticola]TDN94659.1 ergothioneine biosynthesis protein EgtB [Herminiimonas fonticola]
MNVQTERIFLNELPLRYEAVRARSIALAEPLSEEDCCAQSMPDASPVKWHLAHTTWFFETFVLERFEPNFQPHHPAFRVLFNSYYNGIGDKHARAQRGLLTRPPFADVLSYRRDVDARIMTLLAHPFADYAYTELNNLLELGLQHEQQHQELMMTDVLHLLSCNPLKPAYAETPRLVAKPAAEMEWLSFDGGVVQIGHDDQEFCFDNEMPVHRQFLEPYALASRLVTNREYLNFVESGAYENPIVWLSEGWDWVQTQQWMRPLYWQRNDDAWQVFTLHGLQALNLDAAVTQISYFEADAYARWAGARLPTEAEWENAAIQSLNATDNPTDSMQFFGHCWQWTSSSYSPYPGYVTAAGALGEYNGKFMSNQYVLRGSSCVTPDGHSRTTYRNFFPATARWQFSGIRLAR